MRVNEARSFEESVKKESAHTHHTTARSIAICSKWESWTKWMQNPLKTIPIWACDYCGRLLLRIMREDHGPIPSSSHPFFSAGSARLLRALAYHSFFFALNWDKLRFMRNNNWSKKIEVVNWYCFLDATVCALRVSRDETLSSLSESQSERVPVNRQYHR